MFVINKKITKKQHKTHVSATQVFY